MAFRIAPVIPEEDWQLRLEVQDDGIGVLTLCYPEKLNAWSWEATRQLGARATRFDSMIGSVSWWSRPKVGPSVPASTWACPKTGSWVVRRPRRCGTTTRASGGCMSVFESSLNCRNQLSVPCRATAWVSALNSLSCATSALPPRTLVCPSGVLGRRLHRCWRRSTPLP